MGSRHLTLRLDEEAFERLESESRRQGRSRSDLARTLLEEGLRMEAHPGIMFRPGPAGRRAALVGGPDVWEVARVLRDLEDEEGDRVSRAAASLGLNPSQIRAAARYYAAFRDEIDQWIRRNDEEAERAEAAWRREREIIGR